MLNVRISRYLVLLCFAILLVPFDQTAFGKEMPAAKEKSLLTCMAESLIKEHCRSMMIDSQAACLLLAPALACGLRGIGLTDSFCEEACADQLGLRKQLCLTGCSQFVENAPGGPYPPLAMPFLNGACNEATKPLRRKVVELCRGLLTIINKPVENKVEQIK